MRRALVVAAVLFSGGASLVYQVAWIRRLMTVTSATATSQAIVLGVFMLGLGLGAWSAGRRSVRARRPLWGYAAVELAAAALALVSVPLIPGSEALRVGLTGMGLPGAAALWMQVGAVAAFLLLP